MKKIGYAILALGLVMSALAVAPQRAAAGVAADITGTWKFEVTFADGRKGTPTFTFKQEGETLSGTYAGGLGEAPVSGTIKGEAVSFLFKVKPMDQDEITVTFTGTLEAADAMKGTVKATALLSEGTWVAKKQ